MVAHSGLVAAGVATFLAISLHGCFGGGDAEPTPEPTPAPTPAPPPTPAPVLCIDTTIQIFQNNQQCVVNDRQAMTVLSPSCCSGASVPCKTDIDLQADCTAAEVAIISAGGVNCTDAASCTECAETVGWLDGEQSCVVTEQSEVSSIGRSCCNAAKVLCQTEAALVADGCTQAEFDQMKGATKACRSSAICQAPCQITAGSLYKPETEAQTNPETCVLDGSAEQFFQLGAQCCQQVSALCSTTEMIQEACSESEAAAVLGVGQTCSAYPPPLPNPCASQLMEMV